MSAYVAPARYPLTELHRPAPDGTQTVCALPLEEHELWVPVERREGDRLCLVCAAERGAQAGRAAMADPAPRWLASLACGHEAPLAGLPPRAGQWITCPDGRCQGQRRVAAVRPAPVVYVQEAMW